MARTAEIPDEIWQGQQRYLMRYGKAAEIPDEIRQGQRKYLDEIWQGQ
jgi:hypothetical protein